MQIITSKVTQKGQITLPKRFRDMLGITPNSKVTISKNRNYIKIESAGPDILSLAGTLKLPKGAPGILEAREYMEKHYKRF